MIGHLHINQVRQNEVGTRPTFLDDLNQFLRDVQTPTVGPTIIKPLGELGRGVVIKDIVDSIHPALKAPQT